MSRDIEYYKNKFMSPPFTDSPFEEISKGEVFSLLEDIFNQIENPKNTVCTNCLRSIDEKKLKLSN